MKSTQFLDLQDEYTADERKQMLEKMRRLSNAFYSEAVQIGVHSFIEFTGLMNEFIDICRNADVQGVDFVRANTHSNKAMSIADHQIHYLAEKLDCIYGPMLKDPANKRAFVKAFLGED
jgi:lipopolysaccharide biosynthesis protein